MTVSSMVHGLCVSSCNQLRPRVHTYDSFSAVIAERQEDHLALWPDGMTRGMQLRTRGLLWRYSEVWAGQSDWAQPLTAVTATSLWEVVGLSFHNNEGGRFLMVTDKPLRPRSCTGPIMLRSCHSFIAASLVPAVSLLGQSWGDSPAWGRRW